MPADSNPLRPTERHPKAYVQRRHREANTFHRVCLPIAFHVIACLASCRLLPADSTGIGLHAAGYALLGPGHPLHAFSSKEMNGVKWAYTGPKLYNAAYLHDF